MMIKRISVLAMLLFSISGSFAQIGATKKTIESYFPRSQWRSEHADGDYYTQEYRTGKYEITQIMYNKDSIAVAVTMACLDSSYTDKMIANYVQNNFPGFITHKIGANGAETYYLDTAKKALLMVKHTSIKPKSPIKSFSICNDMELINFWLLGVDLFKPE